MRAVQKLPNVACDGRIAVPTSGDAGRGGAGLTVPTRVIVVRRGPMEDDSVELFGTEGEAADWLAGRNLLQYAVFVRVQLFPSDAGGLCGRIGRALKNVS